MAITYDLLGGKSASNPYGTASTNPFMSTNGPAGSAPGKVMPPPQAPIPQPYPTPGPNTSMNPAPGPYSPFGNNPLQVAPPTPPPADQSVGLDPNNVDGNFNPWNPNEKNFYGGQQIAGARPDQADYNAVQGYSDQAYDYSRRYLDPQQAQQNRRMQQELINKGVDPNSAQGQEMQKMLGMQQADQNNAAAFNAMQFGQGIQNQMAQQGLAQQGLAGNMQQALWNAQLGAKGQGLQWELGRMANAMQGRGLDLQGQIANQQYSLGRSSQDLQRYQADLQHQLGMGGLDLQRQGLDFNQMMGLEGLDFRNRQYDDRQQQYQDQITMALMGMTPVPGMTPIDPNGAFGTTLQSAAGNTGILGRLGII